MDKQKVEKAYLLDQIDVAINGAKSVMAANDMALGNPSMEDMEYYNKYTEHNFHRESVEFGTISIKLESGCSFTVANTKESLLRFRKIAKKEFPGSEATLNKSHPQPKYPSLKRKGNLEELLYVSNLNRATGECVP